MEKKWEHKKFREKKSGNLDKSFDKNGPYSTNIFPWKTCLQSSKLQMRPG